MVLNYVFSNTFTPLTFNIMFLSIQTERSFQNEICLLEKSNSALCVTLHFQCNFLNHEMDICPYRVVYLLPILKATSQNCATCNKTSKWHLIFEQGHSKIIVCFRFPGVIYISHPVGRVFIFFSSEFCLCALLVEKSYTKLTLSECIA